LNSRDSSRSDSNSVNKHGVTTTDVGKPARKAEPLVTGMRDLKLLIHGFLFMDKRLREQRPEPGLFKI